MTKTALYRHYDANGRLLYVGITADHVRRTSQHMSADWADQIARSAIEWFATRREAETAERAAIIDEHPRHNLRVVSTPPPIEPDSGWRRTVYLSIQENGDTMRAVSIRAGLSKGYLHGVLVDGKDPTLEKFLAFCAAIPIDPASLLACADIQDEAAQ